MYLICYNKEGKEVTMAFNIEEELKKLPNKPGVYIMHDKDNKLFMWVKQFL